MINVSNLIVLYKENRCIIFTVSVWEVNGIKMSFRLNELFDVQRWIEQIIYSPCWNVTFVGEAFSDEYLQWSEINRKQMELLLQQADFVTTLSHVLFLGALQSPYDIYFLVIHTWNT